MQVRCGFDLDGTLCRTVGRDYANAEPLWPAIRRVNALHDAGHHITVDTARGSGTGKDWTAVTKEQLERWGVRHDALRVVTPARILMLADLLRGTPTGDTHPATRNREEGDRGE